MRREHLLLVWVLVFRLRSFSYPCRIASGWRVVGQSRWTGGGLSSGGAWRSCPGVGAVVPEADGLALLGRGLVIDLR